MVGCLSVGAVLALQAKVLSHSEHLGLQVVDLPKLQEGLAPEQLDVPRGFHRPLSVEQPLHLGPHWPGEIPQWVALVGLFPFIIF